MKTQVALVTSTGRPVAIHNDATPIHDYLAQLVLKENCRWALYEYKIKRFPKSELKKREDYPDLYLVRCGERWLTARECGMRGKIAEAEGYDYRQARDMLYKLCEMKRFGDKELKAIATVIGLLQTEIDEIDECHYDPRTLYEIEELNREFRDHINNDD